MKNDTTPVGKVLANHQRELAFLIEKQMLKKGYTPWTLSKDSGLQMTHLKAILKGDRNITLSTLFTIMWTMGSRLEISGVQDIPGQVVKLTIK